jgi:hypothetical protein
MTEIPVRTVSHSIGLFLVPVGELVCWLTSEGIAASKQTKWAWAIEAAAKVRELGAQKRDVWGFMREVGAKLKEIGVAVV